MNIEDKKRYIQTKISDTKPHLTIGDLYEIYDKCKLYSLIKIIKGEGEVIFNEEDIEERTSDNKEGNIKISL